MFGLRAPELLLIFLVLLLLFGASKLPALGSSLGSAIRNFKKGFGEGDSPAEGDKRPTGTLASSNQMEHGQTPAAQRKDA